MVKKQYQFFNEVHVIYERTIVSMAVFLSVLMHEVRRQMLACCETLPKCNSVRSGPMADFSFGFIQGSFLLKPVKNT